MAGGIVDGHCAAQAGAHQRGGPPHHLPQEGTQVRPLLRGTQLDVGALAAAKAAVCTGTGAPGAGESDRGRGVSGSRRPSLPAAAAPGDPFCLLRPLHAAGHPIPGAPPPEPMSLCSPVKPQPARSTAYTSAAWLSSGRKRRNSSDEESKPCSSTKAGREVSGAAGPT